MPENIEYNWKVSRPYGMLNHSSSGVQSQGTVFTPHGIVLVASDRAVGVTNLTVVHDGRARQRIIDKGYSERYLVTLAARFAAEVSE